jgi:CHAT domain-containing protein
MGMRAFPLRPARSLQPLADRYSEALRSQVEQSPTLSAERRAEAVPEKQRRAAVAADVLRKALLPRGSVPEGTQSVLVVGDGPTLMVPFVALLHGDAPANVRELVMEPSASFLHYLLGRPVQPSRAPRIAVFAAGKSPSPTPGLEQPASFRPGSTAPAALPFVADEAAAIRNVFGAQRTHILSAPESTPAGIQQFDWGSYAIGHFASHATLNRENLQLSGIVLNSEDGGRQRAAGKEEEVTLWYGDICRMQIPLELVVLSACDSANGENIPGEGLVGLSEAFFRAGSQRVLGSIWPADDEATSILMSHFYARLGANRSPAAALREAQRTVAAMERFRAPYYWAGFALSGDWRKLP